MSGFTAKSLLVLSLVFVFISGCETEIDIVAPQRDVTIVYGLLESNKTQHIIRINKAFVGEESAIDLAQVKGVNEYSDEELSAVIIELNQDGSTTGSQWELQDSIIYTKEEGSFNNEANKIYYFDATLNTDKIYRLVCNINVEGEELKEVTAETSVIGSQSATGALEEVRLIKPNLVGASSDPSQADRSEVEFVGPSDYQNQYQISWLRAEGGVAYTSYYRFYYTEVNKLTGERKRDSILYPIGTKRVVPLKSGEIDFQINPEEFYITIDRVMDDIDTQAVDFYRFASDTLQFFLEVADNTLATYIEVNQPVTEIVQEQPEYTNINNGIGVFASRLVTSTRRKERSYESGRVLRKRTLEELLYSTSVNEEYTYSTINKGFKMEGGRCNDVTKICR